MPTQVPKRKRKNAKKKKGKGPAPSRRLGIGRPTKQAIAEASSSTMLMPRIDRHDRHSVRISHRELLRTVTNTGSFNPISFPLNPGMATTFPWLSTQANDWEQYRFHRLEFVYLARCSSTQAGSTILAPDYDAYDPLPDTEQQLCTYLGAVEDAQWKEIRCRLDPSAMFPMGPRKYIRSGRSAGDLKTYDAGQFIVATINSTDTNPVGKLWVEYECELFVPETHLVGSVTAQPQNSSFFILNDSEQTLVDGVPSQIGLTIDPNQNGLGAQVVGTSIFLPSGCYNFLLNFTCSDSVSEAFQVTANINVGGTTVSGSWAAQDSDAGGDVHLSCTAQSVVTGTDPVLLYVVAVGATGTITIDGEYINLIITAA